MTDTVDLSIGLFREAWRVMFANRPGAVAGSADGVDFVFSGLPVAFFNIAFVTTRDDSADALQARARTATAWAADKNLPWLLLMTHEALQAGVDAVTALDGAGLAPMLPLTGMVAHRLAPGQSAPPGLQLLVPEDDRGCSAMLDINAAAYGMSLDAGKPALGTRAFWADHAPALGVVNGTPVSCAAAIEAAGHHYVALVATEPAHQRKGYADAVMRHALEFARRTYGEKPTFLHATEAGRPVYGRMGYETVSTHTVFIEKRFLEH